MFKLYNGQLLFDSLAFGLYFYNLVLLCTSNCPAAASSFDMPSMFACFVPLGSNPPRLETSCKIFDDLRSSILLLDLRKRFQLVLVYLLTCDTFPVWNSATRYFYFCPQSFVKVAVLEGLC